MTRGSFCFSLFACAPLACSVCVCVRACDQLQDEERRRKQQLEEIRKREAEERAKQDEERRRRGEEERARWEAEEKVSLSVRAGENTQYESIHVSQCLHFFQKSVPV